MHGIPRPDGAIFPDTPRVFRFADGAVFGTTENDGVDRLLRCMGRSRGLLHRLESTYGYGLVPLVVTALPVWAGVRHGVPAAAEAMARHDVDATHFAAILSRLERHALCGEDMEDCPRMS